MKLYTLFFLTSIFLMALGVSSNGKFDNRFPSFSIYENMVSFHPIVGSTASSENITAHYGDVILDGDDVFFVKNAQFILNGSLIMKGHSQAVFQNATFILNLPYSWIYNVTLSENSKMIFKNATFRGGIFDFLVQGNSTLESYGSVIDKEIRVLENANVKIENSYIYSIEISKPAFMLMTNSTAYYIHASNASIRGSKVESLKGGDVIAEDSNVSEVIPYGSGTLQFVNTTYKYVTREHTMRDAVFVVKWYLRVLVKIDDSPIEGANVEVFYKGNSSLAGQGITGPDGIVQMVLTEWIITQRGDINLSDYEIKVTYQQASSETTITLDSSKNLTIKLSKTHPLDNPVILGVAITATALAVAIIVLAYMKMRKTRTYDKQHQVNKSL